MLKFIFDLDGTITSTETLPIISKKFNVHREMTQLTEDTVSGKVPWKDSFIHRVDLLRHVSVRDINKLLEHTPTHPLIVEFIRKNKQQCCIATGNLACWIDRLCKRIGCQYHSSIADVKNDEILRITYIMEKADIVKMYKREGYKVVFIGDSNNDVNAMRVADVAVAFGASHNPSNLCLSVANYAIYSEKELTSTLTDTYILVRIRTPFSFLILFENTSLGV